MESQTQPIIAGASTLRADWDKRIARCLADAAEALRGDGETTHVVAPTARTAEPTAVDWTGFPNRVATCLSSLGRARRLLDWRGATGNEGRYRLQEEYLEWRVVRDEDGALRRLEFTTELPDSWQSLAACAPEQVMALVSEFAGEPEVPVASVFGHCNPFDANTSSLEREKAFTSTMLSSPASPYNDGTKGICCMVQPTNTLAALITLAVAACVSRATRDGKRAPLRPLTAVEAIPLLAGAAEAGRNSDPVIVERLGSLAFEGRLVSLDSVGVYIQDVEHTRLRTPDGAAVPKEWFSFSRSDTRDGPLDGRSRYRRLQFEVPTDTGWSISDLIDASCEQQIRFGGQVAEMVQLAVLLRVSEPGVLNTVNEVDTRKRPHVACTSVKGDWAHFEADVSAGKGRPFANG